MLELVHSDKSGLQRQRHQALVLLTEPISSDPDTWMQRGCERCTGGVSAQASAEIYGAVGHNTTSGKRRILVRRGQSAREAHAVCADGLVLVPCYLVIPCLTILMVMFGLFLTVTEDDGH